MLPRPFQDLSNLPQDITNLVVKFYRLEQLVTIATLPFGYENLVFLLTTVSGSFVLRLTTQRTLAQLEAEVKFANEVRTNGFNIVPIFRQHNEQKFALETRLGNVTLYEYINGVISDPLTDTQFDTIATIVPVYFSAKSNLGAENYEARGYFPYPPQLLQRLEYMIKFRGINPEKFMQEFGIDPNLFVKLQPPPYDVIIHGDLHAGNFIWDEETKNVLVGIIDFDDCCIGNDWIELFTLIRGSCFVDDSIQLSRVEKLVIALRETFINKPEPTNDIVENLLCTIWYFGVAVNEARKGRMLAPLNTHDFTKSISVQTNRNELISLFNSLLT